MSKKYLCAVTGDPILHSKSPVIFNAVFKHMNINGYYSRLAADTALEAVEMFNNLGLSGMNITAPFKKDIMPFMDYLDESCEIIGGVNTVIPKNGQLHGYNTDHFGVYNSFKNRDINIKGKRTIILGAGGAGRAACYGMVKNDADVVIVNRTVEKAKKIAEKLKCKYSGLEKLPDLIKGAEIIVSSLSGNYEVIKKEWLNDKIIIFDANYKESSLITYGEEIGCIVIKGEEWLVNQAIPAFNYFIGIQPDSDIMKEAVSQKNTDNKKKYFTIISNDKHIRLAEKVAQKYKYNFINNLNDISKIKLDQEPAVIFLDHTKVTNTNSLSDLIRESTIVLLLNKDIKNIENVFENIDIIVNADNKIDIKIYDKITNEIDNYYFKY